jgi:hypothetical protein
MFSSSNEGREISILLDPVERANPSHWLTLSKRPNRVGVPLLSPEDGKRYSFGNAVFSSYLEFRTMDNVHKPSDSEYSIIHLWLVICI